MIEVELPDGTVVEFPAGTDHATMQAAIQRHLGAPAPQQYSDFEDVTETMARGMVRGIPIAGPYLERGIEHVEGWLTGKPQEEIQARGQQLQEQHPTITTGSEIAGGFAGSAVPVAMAPRVFGATGSLVPRVAAGAGSGAGVAAADAAVRGQDPAQAAAIGGAAGGAGALVGRALEAVRRSKLTTRPSVAMLSEYRALPEAAKTSRAGKDLYTHAKAAEQLENIIERGGSPNAIRGQFRRIINSPKELGRYPDEMKQVIRNIAFGQGEVDVSKMAAEMAAAWLPGVGRPATTYAAQKNISREMTEATIGMLTDLTGSGVSLAQRTGTTLPIVAAGQAVEPARSRAAQPPAPTPDLLQQEMIDRLMGRTR